MPFSQLAASNSWHFLACICITPISDSIFTWPFLLCICVPNITVLALIMTAVIGFRPHLKSRVIYVIINYIAKTLFPNKITFTGTRDQHLFVSFWGPQFNPWQRNSLNLIKNIYKYPTANIVFNGEILNAFPLRLGTRQGCLLSQLSYSIKYWKLQLL